MKMRSAIAGLAVAVLALFCAAQAAAEPLPSAPALMAGAARLNDELSLLGQGSSTLGLPRNQSLSELRFENSDGYKIAVVAFGQTVALSVTRAHGRQKHRNRISTTTYLAHGKVTPTSIAASFGDRGRIAVRFQPTGRKVRATRKAGCKTSGDGILAHIGVFAGELRFEGEGGYTSAEIHRVRGRSVDFTALLACLFGSSPGRHAVLPPPRSPLGLRLPGLVGAGLRTAASAPGVRTHPSTRPRSTTLLADSKAALSRTVFAAQVRGQGRSHFIALDEVSEGSIGVIRLAFARSAPSAFGFDGILSSATVAPPPPFSGAGTLNRGPGRTKSWAGSLAVSFLGAPRVPLTGAPFDAWLVRGW
ncbi:MAG TPA: hypothetical protein VF085_05375 [Solirubrobacterales bacterium]